MEYKKSEQETKIKNLKEFLYVFIFEKSEHETKIIKVKDFDIFNCLI